MASDDYDGDEGTASAEAFVLPPLLPWQREPLARWLAGRDQWHHATLLYGPAGSGSRRLALQVARGLLCQTPVPGGACGACHACRLFAAGSHPDFRFVERLWDEKSLKGADPRRRDAIIVDQVRAVIDNFVYLSAHLSVAKLIKDRAPVVLRVPDQDRDHRDHESVKREEDRPELALAWSPSGHGDDRRPKHHYA